jgi:hypothetical protein
MEERRVRMTKRMPRDSLPDHLSPTFRRREDLPRQRDPEA